MSTHLSVRRRENSNDKANESLTWGQTREDFHPSGEASGPYRYERVEAWNNVPKARFRSVATHAPRGHDGGNYRNSKIQRNTIVYKSSLRGWGGAVRENNESSSRAGSERVTGAAREPHGVTAASAGALHGPLRPRRNRYAQR